MKRPRARPRFSFEVDARPEDVTAQVRRHLEGAEKIEGGVYARTLSLTLRDGFRHFWTPHLDVQLTELPAGRTRIDGLFAPHPQLWTGFVALQLFFGLLSLGALIWLYSQYTLDRPLLTPTLVLGGMLFGGGFSYGAAYVGQGLGSEQMYELRSFLDQALAR